jgi:O-acetylhomoserine (thiol)-lyase
MNLLKYTFKKLGIEVTFVEDQADLQPGATPCVPNTKAFFAETIANPKADVLDIAGVAGVAHEAGVPLVVDNTIATPYLIRPLEWGADVVVHSATKYLGGHGTSIAGVIVDGGTFDYGQDPERFPNYNTPDESYHGLVYARDLGVGGALRREPRPTSSRRACSCCATSGRRSRRSTPSSSRRASRRSACASSGTSRTPRGGGLPPGRPPAGGVGALGLARRQPEQGAGRQVRTQGRRVRCSPSRSPVVSRRAALRRGARRCTATSPTSVTCARWRSTRHRRRTARVATRTAWPRASRPGLVRLAVGLESIDDILADLDAGFAAAAGASPPPSDNFPG